MLDMRVVNDSRQHLTYMRQGSHTLFTALPLTETTMATFPCSGDPMSTSAEGSPSCSCKPLAASCKQSTN